MNSQERMNLLKQLLTMLGGIGTGAGVLSAAQAASLVNELVTAISAIVTIASIVASVYAHYKMVKVPASTVVSIPGKTSPVAAGTALKSGILSALLLGILVLGASHAHAAAAKAKPKAAATATTGKLTAAQVQANPLAVLQQISTTDLQAALSDAQAQKDTVSAPCWQALLTAAQTQQSAGALTLPSGIFSAIQKARDVKLLAASALSPTGPLSTLNVACAPLLVDANATLALLGVSTGLVVGSGGIALPALPGLLPLLLAPK